MWFKKSKSIESQIPKYKIIKNVVKEKQKTRELCIFFKNNQAGPISIVEVAKIQSFTHTYNLLDGTYGPYRKDISPEFIGKTKGSFQHFNNIHEADINGFLEFTYKDKSTLLISKDSILTIESRIIDGDIEIELDRDELVEC